MRLLERIWPIVFVLLIFAGSALIPPLPTVEQPSQSYSYQEPSEQSPNPWEIASAIGAIVAAIFTGVLAYYAFREVSDSRESSERQLRAYISTVTADSGLDPDGFRVRAVLKNCGMTPAHITEVKAALRFCSDAVERDYRAEEISIRKLSLGPGCEHPVIIRVNDFMTNEARAEHVKYTARKFVVFSDIKYLDAFGDEQRTSFQYVLPPNILKITPLDADVEGNNAT